MTSRWKPQLCCDVMIEDQLECPLVQFTTIVRFQRVQYHIEKHNCALARGIHRSLAIYSFNCFFVGILNRLLKKCRGTLEIGWRMLRYIMTCRNLTAYVCFSRYLAESQSCYNDHKYIGNGYMSFSRSISRSDPMREDAPNVTSSLVGLDRVHGYTVFTFTMLVCPLAILIVSFPRPHRVDVPRDLIRYDVVGIPKQGILIVSFHIRKLRHVTKSK